MRPLSNFLAATCNAWFAASKFLAFTAASTALIADFIRLLHKKRLIGNLKKVTYQLFCYHFFKYIFGHNFNTK